MALGNGNPKEGDKGSNFNYELKVLQGLEAIAVGLEAGIVQDITVTAPLVSTGGSTPDLSIPKATGSVDGYLESTDWNTFNNKQNTLTLTTTGTSGAATLVGATLNIPQYSGGSASSGTHTPFELGSGQIYSNIPIGASNSTTPMSTNLIYIMPFKPAQTFTTSNIFVNVSVLGAGVNARILLYSHSATNGLPDTKIYESANLDCSTTGVKTATTAQTFTAGTTYWLGLHTSGAVTLAGVVVASLIQIGVDSTTAQYTSISRSVAFGSAPSTWGTTGTQLSATFPRIGLTIA